MAGRVKPGHTREFSGIPEKYPERARRYGALYHRDDCTNHGVLKYARRTMCTRYKCQKAATAERVARLADGGGDDAVVPTWSTWSAVINLTSRAGELRSAPSGPDDRHRVTG